MHSMQRCEALHKQGLENVALIRSEHNLADTSSKYPLSALQSDNET